MTWRLPSRSLFPPSPVSEGEVECAERVERIGDLLTEKLGDLGARCEVSRITTGPTTIEFEMVPAEGVLVRSLAKLAPELSYEVAATSVRVVAPVPGRRAVAIQIPNPWRRTIALGDVLTAARAPLTFPLGLGADGALVACDIARQPHVLVAGTTGAGKTSLLNSMLCSLLAVDTPDDLALVLVDPKGTEFVPFQDLPHLLCDVVTDAQEAGAKLGALVGVMEKRYRRLADYGCRDYAAWRAAGLPKRGMLPLLIVVDELADLMMQNRKVIEPALVRILQKGRACAMHVVMATQSPYATVVTGLLRANTPARVGLTTARALDSRVILERNGCESLTGLGDALWLAGGSGVLQRVQTPYSSEDDVEAIVDHWRAQTREEVIA